MIKWKMLMLWKTERLRISRLVAGPVMDESDWTENREDGRPTSGQISILYSPAELMR